ASLSRSLGGGMGGDLLAESLAVSLAQLVTTTPTIGIAITVLTGLLIVSVSRSVIGQRASTREIWDKVRPRVGALIVFSILLNLTLIAAAGLVARLVLAFASLDQLAPVVLPTLVGLPPLT